MAYIPALQGQGYKLVSSSRIFRLLCLQHSGPSPLLISSASSLVPWLLGIRHFSFTDDYNGSTKCGKGKTEDFCPPKTDSDFSGNGGNNNREGYCTQQCQPFPRRPLRSDMQFNQPPPRFQEFNRGSRSFPSQSDNCGRPSDLDRINKSSQTECHFRGQNMAAETNSHINQSEDNFLDKFRLGFYDKRQKPSEGQSDEAKRMNPDQPEPEAPPQDAHEIFNKMKETGLIPNAVAMLDGLCKDGLVQEAMKLFGLMREKGTIPEIVIYTAVVEGYTKAQKADDAKNIFRKMQSNGILPNAFSYTVLIQGLYKCNRLQDAVEFCVEMLEAGHSPNVTTFVGLVDSLCKEKGVVEAQGVIKRLIEKGLVVNEKAVREFLDRKAPFSSPVWEAIFGKKAPQRPF